MSDCPCERDKFVDTHCVVAGECCREDEETEIEDDVTQQLAYAAYRLIAGDEVYEETLNLLASLGYIDENQEWVYKEESCEPKCKNCDCS